MSMISSTVLALQGVSDGYGQIDGVEQFALLVVERSEPDGAVALVESDLMHLDPAGDVECALGRVLAAMSPQPHAQHAVEHECQEADQRVRADALRQPMEHRRDLDLALEHPEAALDVGERLVARDDLLRRVVGHVGDQYELAVNAFGAGEHLFVNAVGEEIRTQIDPQNRGQVCSGSVLLRC